MRRFVIFLAPVFIFLLFAFIFFPSKVEAATLSVNTTSDVINSTDGYCSLREATIAANTDTASGSVAGECAAGSGNDTINVPAGTYTLTITGTQEDAAATGDLDITTDMIIQGANKATTIIDGNNTDRIFQILNGPSNVSISNLTLQHGDTVDIYTYGGAISVEQTINPVNTFFDNLNVINNTSQGDSNDNCEGGGGIAYKNDLGKNILTNSNVSNNTVIDTDCAAGGGIMSWAPLTMDNTTVSGNSSNYSGGIDSDFGIIITNSTITENISVSGDGGGISIYKPSSIKNSTITYNSATSGSGAGIAIFTSPGELYLSNLTVTNNSGNSGGGIYANNGDIYLRDSVVDNNSVDGWGGGIYISWCNMTITNTTFNNNTSTASGGGIYHSGNGTSQFNNITVSNNSADSSGGGMYIQGAGSVTVNNSTISHNNTVSLNQNGGGIYNTDSLTLNNTSVDNNTTTGNGGGVYSNTLSDLTINNTEIISNNSGGLGGGLYVSGNGDNIINYSTIDNNISTGQGGGIYNHANVLDLIYSQVNANNSGSSGGGIYNPNSFTVNLSGSKVENNQSTTDGGGIFNDGTLTSDYSSISGNSAGGGGGGINNSSSATLQQTLLYSNSSIQDGGGIRNNGALSITNTTFSTNDSHANGGAIIHWQGTLNVLNSTFAFNTSVGSNGGIRVDGSATATIKNTILRNAGSNCNNEVNNITSGGHNISSDGSCTTRFTATGDLNNTNPDLGFFQDNGGLTSTYVPNAGSPAIDAGDNTGAPSVDQRGVLRPQNTTVDIGAVETGDTTAPVITLDTPVTTPTNTSTPVFILSSTKAGTIININCFITTKYVPSGSSDISFSTIADGTHSNCQVALKDGAGNTSNTLNIPSFTVDTTAPTISQVTAVPSIGNDTTPNYTFTTNEAGTITYSGDCSSATTSASSGSNTITFHALVEGFHSNCTLTVTDSAGNISTPLVVSPFEIDSTIPSADPSSFSSATPLSTPTVGTTLTVNWSKGGDDELTGVSGYSYSFTNNATDVPDNVQDIPATTFSVTSSTLAPGTWYMHLRTKDVAGNWTSTAHYGPFVLIAAPATTTPTTVITTTTAAVTTTTAPLITVTTATPAASVGAGLTNTGQYILYSVLAGITILLAVVVILLFRKNHTEETKLPEFQWRTKVTKIRE